MSKNTSLEDRQQIVTLLEGGLSVKDVADQTGWAQRTVRKWRQRKQQEGRAGLASAMGRPRQGALSACRGVMRETVHGWRTAHPGWGPKTLRAELEKAPALVGQTLPSRSSIGRYLHEQGLTRSYEKHSDLPEAKHANAEHPHEVWELDARSYSTVPAVGVIGLVNLNDRASHTRLLSYPVWVGDQRRERHPDTADYQTALRLAMTDFGLPEQLQVDRASVFIDNKTKSPFPTRLHLWLVALGVDLIFGRPARPTDQGMTERSHQLWTAQCLAGQHYASWEDLYRALRQRRDFLNHDLPCSSLDDQPPLVAFPQAAHSGRPYRPEWEADLLDLSRVWAYLAQGRWFRKSSQAYTFSLGGQVYYLGRPWQHAQLELTFDPAARHFLCHNDAAELVGHFPIQGVSLVSLMGDLFAYTHLPMFQLALPFDWPTSQSARLLETIAA